MKIKTQGSHEVKESPEKDINVGEKFQKLHLVLKYHPISNPMIELPEMNSSDEQEEMEKHDLVLSEEEKFQDYDKEELIKTLNTFDDLKIAGAEEIDFDLLWMESMVCEKSGEVNLLKKKFEEEYQKRENEERQKAVEEEWQILSGVTEEDCTKEVCNVCQLQLEGCSKIKEIDEVKIDPHLFNGNKYYQELFKEYLASEGKSVEEIYLKAIRLIRLGKMSVDYQGLLLHWNYPWTDSVKGKAISEDFQTCQDCQLSVVDYIILCFCCKYREEIEGNKVPCFHGLDCVDINDQMHQSDFTHLVL